ncbi:MAG: FG-GAP-like repeat-containing protein [Acidobacteriota bacterium]|nr:FG-GAP-like repeat-containing protein [Acidobacteriota bacterium]
MITGPVGSVAFGASVTLLPNGNFVVTDPQFNPGGANTENAGAVYLFSPTGVQISRIAGATGNSFVGSGGITVLSNGDFVISSPRWTRPASLPQNNAIVGAVTKCSGVTGCSGQVSDANSLTGNINGDNISNTGNANQSGVTALPNGNYVVRSPFWGMAGFPNNTPNIGSVTFCNAATNSCAGQNVTASNSLVGTVGGDFVGTGGVTVLSSGNYVVSSPSWKKSSFAAGAVTVCSGTNGCVGAVSTANSLTGSNYSELGGGDSIGNSGVFALPNNMYLVASSNWIKPSPLTGGVGAVTLCDATTNNCTGQIVSGANSLTGSTANDNVGTIVKILPSGDYLLNTPFWHNPSGGDGAVTLCRAATNNCAGQVVSTSNSLTGNNVGFGINGIILLTNGNYVVSSPGWYPNTSIQSAGAATFCNATSNSCAGQVISAANSLVGSQFGDGVSGGAAGGVSGITPLTNGNYVVLSPFWNNGTDINGVDVGAATLCSGTSGCTGLVLATNSLIGAAAVDNVGVNGATALSNGNYVVNSSNWTAQSTQSGFGAATLCNGTANNCAGQFVSAANSLTGSKITDRVGLNGSLALTNGNYVVISSQWDISTSVTDVGATTFCNAATNHCAGQQVSAVNSLIGSTTEDLVGVLTNPSGDSLTYNTNAVALPNGNYIIRSSKWNNGTIIDAGAVTISNGTTGVSGTINSANSIMGSTEGNGAGINIVHDATGNRIFIGMPKDNKVVLVGVAIRKTPFDFDGDGKTDLAVFRPSTGYWFIVNSSNSSLSIIQFGANGDLIAPADFDGDGKTDINVFRPSDGGWYRLNSSNNTFSPAQFGTNGDLPAPGDFDGDGKADLTVFRPSTGSWFRVNSSNSQFVAAQFGANGDKPLVADFDGDGKSDLAVYRPSDGGWYRINSASDTFSPTRFGTSEDKPVPADYDGDGKADLAVYRPSVGDWYIINSSTGSFTATHFGISEDKPSPGDFDADGKSDLVVWRPSNGTWYLLRSTAGFTGIQFGSTGDAPASNAYVR